MTGPVDKQWELLDGPLFEAAEQGLAWQAKQLLDKGANPNVRDGGGMTPLHSAAIAGEMEVFRLLLENGADIAARTVRGKTPLDVALANGQSDIVSFIQDKTGTAPRVPVMKPIKLIDAALRPRQK